MFVERVEGLRSAASRSSRHLLSLVMNPAESPLLTDLYQLNMIQAYLDHG